MYVARCCKAFVFILEAVSLKVFVVYFFVCIVAGCVVLWKGLLAVDYCCKIDGMFARYTYNCKCHFCLWFRTCLFVRALLPETPNGLGTTGTLGSLSSRFGHDPCCVSRAWQAFYPVLPAGMDEI